MFSAIVRLTARDTISGRPSNTIVFGLSNSDVKPNNKGRLISTYIYIYIYIFKNVALTLFIFLVLFVLILSQGRWLVVAVIHSLQHEVRRRLVFVFQERSATRHARVVIDYQLAIIDFTKFGESKLGRSECHGQCYCHTCQRHLSQWCQTKDFARTPFDPCARQRLKIESSYYFSYRPN